MKSLEDLIMKIIAIFGEGLNVIMDRRVEIEDEISLEFFLDTVIYQFKMMSNRAVNLSASYEFHPIE